MCGIKEVHLGGTLPAGRELDERLDCELISDGTPRRRGRVLQHGQCGLGSGGFDKRLVVQDVGKTVVKTDASAAMGTSAKVGTFEVNQVSLQGNVTSENLRVEKVSTEENLADALTKGDKSSRIETRSCRTASLQRVVSYLSQNYKAGAPEASL